MHQETFELNCSRTPLAMDGTLVVVVKMSLSTWLVCAEVPGLERRAMMKMSVDEAELLSQLHRWRDEAEKRADCRVSRICVAYEAGRDGFWLARCLRGNGIEAHVMHSTSIPVKRDHRRAKTDRLDCQLMMRAFPRWLRREEGHCRMVAVPTAEQEDARRVTRERKGLVREQTKLINRLKAMFACLGIRNFKPHLKKAPERLDGLLTPEGDPIPANTLAEIRRAMDRLVLVREQIKEIEDTRAEKIAQETPAWHHAMVGKLATIHGLGVDTADMLVSEVFYRDIGPIGRFVSRWPHQTRPGTTGDDEAELLSQLHRWRDEAEKRADCRVSRICVAYEAGRDGFWLARCLRGNGIEAHVMHSTSIPVKRDHRRAKTDRLDCQLMMRAFLGWLRREEGHCRMVAVPTAEQEDARRVTRERKGLVREQTKLINRLKAMFACLGIRNFKPHLKKAPERLDGLLTPEGDPIPANTLAEIRRAMDRLVLVRAQIKEIEDTRAEKIAQETPAWHHAMVGKLATIHGLGVDTADMLVSEVFYRDIPNRQALARYGGLTGSPNESGQKRREKGLSRSGNPRVRNGLIQFAWRFLKFQPDSELACWYRERTLDGRPGIRKKMIVALARKLLVALWKFVTLGDVPKGVIVKPVT